VFLAEEAPETAPEGPCGGAQTLEIPELMGMNKHKLLV